MSLRLYMDEQVPFEITARLRAAGVDVLTVQEDDFDASPDEEVLDRATALKRELFTQDDDFFRIVSRRQKRLETFSGVFYAIHDSSRNRLYAEWLETRAKLENPEDVAGRVIHIP